MSVYIIMLRINSCSASALEAGMQSKPKFNLERVRNRTSPLRNFQWTTSLPLSMFRFISGQSRAERLKLVNSSFNKLASAGGSA